MDTQDIPSADQSIEPVEQPTSQEGKPATVDKTVDDLNKKIGDHFAKEAKDSKSHRRTFHGRWRRNVQLRMGQPMAIVNNLAQGDPTAEAVEDDLLSEVNPDWSLSKTKTANLFSQVPTIRGTHENKQYAAAVSPFMKELNYQLGEKRANVAVCMEEALNDVVNASGVAGVLVGYAARFEDVVDPKIPQGALDQLEANSPGSVQRLIDAKKLPTIPRAVSDKFFASRLSPSDLLWPKSFKGSDFNNAPWVGYTGEKWKSEGKVDFKLTDIEIEEILGGKEGAAEDDLTLAQDRGANGLDDDNQKIYFDHIFYWRYLQDPDELNMKAIWEIVFVHGKSEPVVHGPCRCQQLVPGSKNQYVGACKFPLQFLTLTYITDNPVNLSDSEAGRPQVNDLRRSRSQMFANRARSTPLRWYDVNRTNKDVQMMLMRGDIQGFIPTNGPGDKVIGEVARAGYPPEDGSFDRTTMQDLMTSWQIGPNQMGTVSTGEHTKGEADLTQANFSTRIGQERARVAQFFINIAEIISAYLALYGDFKSLTDQERQAMMQAWDSRKILTDLVMTVRPDSTVVLDSQAQFNKLNAFLNMTVKSGYINPLPILTQMAELAGLDPAEVVVQPKPPQPPEDVNISYRFSGKDDLMNPAVIALLDKKKKLPSPENVANAKKFLQAVSAPDMPQPAPVPGNPVGAGGPQAAPAGGANAHPDWQLASKVAQRSEDAGIPQ